MNIILVYWKTRAKLFPVHIYCSLQIFLPFALFIFSLGLSLGNQIYLCIFVSCFPSSIIFYFFLFWVFRDIVFWCTYFEYTYKHTYIWTQSISHKLSYTSWSLISEKCTCPDWYRGDQVKRMLCRKENIQGCPTYNINICFMFDSVFFHHR